MGPLRETHRLLRSVVENLSPVARFFSSESACPREPTDTSQGGGWRWGLTWHVRARGDQVRQLPWPVRPPKVEIAAPTTRRASPTGDERGGYSLFSSWSLTLAAHLLSPARRGI